MDLYQVCSYDALGSKLACLGGVTRFYIGTKKETSKFFFTENGRRRALIFVIYQVVHLMPLGSILALIWEPDIFTLWAYEQTFYSGPLGDSTQRISKLYAFQYQSKRILKFSFFLPMFQFVTPGQVSVDPRVII